MKIHQWQGGKKEFSLVDDTKAKKFALKYIKNNDTVLDIGCGDCLFFDIVKNSKENCKFYGFDIIKEALDICKKKGYNSVNTLNKLNLKFDVITMFECFEHLDYGERVKHVEIINKLLKDNGYFILSFPYIKSMLSLQHYHDNPEHKMPYPLEKNLTKFFYNYKIIDKLYFNPWLNPLKVLHCVLTGLSFNVIYNNICYVLVRK